MRRDKQLRLETEGHDERHAMVAALSMHLPEYGPDGGAESTGLCRTALSADGCRAVTTLSAEGRTVTGAAEWTEELAPVLPAGTEDDLSRRRRWLVGTSVYRAACAFTGARPPWGSLSGVRPAKVAGRMLRRGMSRADADLALRQVYELAGEKARMVLDAAEERERTAASLRPGESALYVGIPFCPTVCRYCSFVNRAATPERLETVLFSGVSYTNRFVLVAKAGSAAAEAGGDGLSSYDLAGQKVGCLSAAPTADMVRKFFNGDVTVEYFNFDSDLAYATEHDIVPAFISNSISAQRACLLYPDLTILAPDVAAYDISFMFRKDDPEAAALCEKMSAFIGELRADGTLDALDKKWMCPEPDGADIDIELTG